MGHEHVVPLYEPVSFSLSFDEAIDIRFIKILPEFDLTFSICENGLSYHVSSWALRGTPWPAIIYTESVEAKLRSEQLQDILKYLERAEQVLRTNRSSQEAGKYYWRIDLVSRYYTTFFYIDGKETYQQIRSFLHMPTYHAHPTEVHQLRDVFLEYRDHIQEAMIEFADRSHELWPVPRTSITELESRRIQEELHVLRWYYIDERIQAYFEEALNKLTEAYEDSDSNVSFEYRAFQMYLTELSEYTISTLRRWR